MCPSQLPLGADGGLLIAQEDELAIRSLLGVIEPPRFNVAFVVRSAPALLAGAMLEVCLCWKPMENNSVMHVVNAAKTVFSTLRCSASWCCDGASSG